MACDIIIAAEHAMFGLPEIRNTGGFPSDGGILRLPRHIPLKIAMDMLLTGRYITAQEALQYGLINRIVPKEELMAAATAKAEEINQNPPMTVRISKETVMRSLDRPLEYAEHPENAWCLFDEMIPRLRETEDYKSREGPRAFAEKRKPIWKGR
jgi:crotonobetainyl-CoA hydratase